MANFLHLQEPRRMLLSFSLPSLLLVWLVPVSILPQQMIQLLWICPYCSSLLISLPGQPIGPWMRGIVSQKEPATGSHPEQKKKGLLLSLWPPPTLLSRQLPLLIRMKSVPANCCGLFDLPPQSAHLPPCLPPSLLPGSSRKSRSMPDGLLRYMHSQQVLEECSR